MFFKSRRSSFAPVVGFCLLMTALGSAQTPVTTTGGTTNSVPKFSSTTALVNSAITESNGNVGIGTTTPMGLLDVYSATTGITKNYGGFSQFNNFSRQYSVGVLNGTSFQIRDDSAAGTPVNLAIDLNGNVGIGTTSPTAKLEVNGTLRFTGDTAGTVQTTAWTGVLCGGDYAESVDVSGDRTHYEPGDVLVLDQDHPGNFLKSSEPYSTLVSGIYSTKPGVVGRRQSTEKNKAEVPMAMIGIVPTKVSAENGAIRVGDLLVSSSKPGYAMKGTDRSLLTGAVIGKAMGSLSSGTGVIEVLVTLQ